MGSRASKATRNTLFCRHGQRKGVFLVPWPSHRFSLQCCDYLSMDLTVDRGALSISASRHPGSSLGTGFGL
jgi:hypothetical protein